MTPNLEQKITSYIERHPEQSFTEMSARLKVARSTLAKLAKRNGIIRRPPVSPDLEALEE
jgi:DNA-binding MurR/RpiR family transcriptional regulator